MNEAYIYIVFSATPYRIGKIIRRVTKETYNHISIALDAELCEMYGFARRYYRLPLYGGFVKESLARYHLKQDSAQLCVCRIPVTQLQYQRLKEQLSSMYRQRDLYIYNHLSALGALFRKPVKVKRAYTCVEFCTQVLYELGIHIDPAQYHSVCDVLELLKSYMIYTGPAPVFTGTDPTFFAKKPVTFPVLITLRELCKLIPRLDR